MVTLMNRKGSAFVLNMEWCVALELTRDMAQVMVSVWVVLTPL